ncbi:MAG: transposase [Chloroflexia bacterium]|nr:transposase [Chloroflexia bacterium]
MTAPWSLQDPAPTLPVSLFDPVWHHIAALLPERPTTHPGHPLGCHLPRIVDRLVFEPVLAALVDGSGDERVPSAGCADQTIRRRVHEWAEVGLGETLHAPVPDQYGQTIGLDREDLAVDGRITMAPCGGERAGRSPVDRAKRGLKRSTLTDGAGVPGCRVSARANRHDAPSSAPRWRVRARATRCRGMRPFTSTGATMAR